MAAGSLLVSGIAAAATAIPPYLASLDPDWQATPLLSVADRVPVTGDPSREYQMIGIPDGLGAHANGDGTATLFMNHELVGTAMSEPYVGGALNRGAFASRYVLDGDGNPISGARAYDDVYQENTWIGPAADATNATRAFARFCSGQVFGPDHGLDRWIFFTGEESGGSGTFDGLGGQSVAIFDGKAHALPRLGRFAKETTVVMRGTNKRTVVFPTEDGPATLDNQLYLYVGTKQRGRGANALRRNGLDNGTLYVFRSLDPSRNSELTFQSGTITGEWIPVQGAESMSDGQLEAAVDALGAFTLIRPEDAEFNPEEKNELFFVTTGGNAAQGNELGRLYLMQLDKQDPADHAQLTIVYNADAIVAAGGDVAISPDNIGVSEGFVAINEDGTSQSRAVMASKGRDGSIWLFPIDADAPWEDRVDVDARFRPFELDPPGRDGVPVGPGVWETSGIIDTSSIFGDGTWMTDVQAHGPTAAPAANTVEDGQLLLIRPAP
jgi:hypothetical protein